MKQIKKKVIKSIDKNTKNMKYGNIVFGVGLLIAVIMSLVVGFSSIGQTASQVVTAILIALGIVIGYLNITSQESTNFLVAAIVLVMLIGPFLGNLMQTYSFGTVGAKLLGEFFKNIIGLVVPAAIVVAIKTIFQTAKDE